MSVYLVYYRRPAARFPFRRESVILGPVLSTRDEAALEVEKRNGRWQALRQDSCWSWVALGTVADFAGYIV